MPEILTESFCERCGTRYTFEAAIPKKRRIGKLKVLSKGLKNYVLSDDASLDEALAEARSDEQRELSGGQLDAFHKTFNFCMTCRQYTCPNCWNEAEARCLTCAPLSLGAGLFRTPLDDLFAGGGMAPLVSRSIDTDASMSMAAEGNGHVPLEEPPPPMVMGTAWPTIDLFRTADPEPIVEPAPEPIAKPLAEAVIETQSQADSAPELPAAAAPEVGLPADFWTRPFTGYAPILEPTNGHGPADSVGLVADGDADAPDQPAVRRSEDEPPVIALEPIAEPSPVAASTPDARSRRELAARTTRLLGRFRVQAPVGEAGPSTQPAVVAEAAPEPPAEAGRIPAAQTEPETVEPTMPAAEPVAAQPKPAAAATDRIETPVWPTSQSPAVQSAPGPSAQVQPVGRPARSPVEAPQWPAPLRPGVDLSIPAFWASGDVARETRDAGLWTASAQEVAGAPGQAAVPGGIQSCVSCGLSLSATARFCRRCGSRQS